MKSSSVLVVFLLAMSALGMCMPDANGQSIEMVGKLKLKGDVQQPDELSGIAYFQNLLVVCPDEEASFSFLQNSGQNEYTALPPIKLLNTDAELDLEGAASDDQFVYLIGSHGLARKAVKPERTYLENRKLLSKIQKHDEADSLFRLKVSNAGSVERMERISLRDLLEADETLRPFNRIPSKENGIDIEGIAIKDGRIYLGFRGPILRGNFVPVMIFKFDNPSNYELRYLDLGGRGIRDLTRVSDGFLLIAGPNGDGDQSYLLCFWNGKDCVPGDGSPDGRLEVIAELPSEPEVKPEGIAIVNETASEWQFLLVRDGERDVRIFSAKKP